MYNAKDALIEVCYSNKLIETRVLSNQKRIIDENIMVLNKFIESISKLNYIQGSNHYLWRDISAE